MTQLTLEDFVKSLMGTKFNASKKELKRATRTWSCRDQIEELRMKWDGYTVYIYVDGYDLDSFVSFPMDKYNHVYDLHLDSAEAFTFRFEMCGEQLIKNKEYRIIDFYE
jgi:hypothetical protein